MLRQHSGEKIVTLNWLHKILVTATSGQIVASLSETALGTILYWLNVQVSMMCVVKFPQNRLSYSVVFTS